MRIKAERRGHAEDHAQHKRENRGADVKSDQASQFHQHHKKREQQDIQHAPATSVFHQSIGERLVSPVEQSEQAEFKQK